MKPNRLRYCTTCPLKGNPTVWSEGHPSSPIYFIGRNPGNTEVEKGRPFVGRAGIRLNRVLEEIGLSRSDVYITNLVKCWTLNDNVPPVEAVECCWPYLKKELGTTHPLVVALGKQCQAFLTTQQVSHFAMIHPAAAIRRGLHEAILRRDTRLLKKELEGVCQRKGTTNGKPSSKNSKRGTSS